MSNVAVQVEGLSKQYRIGGPQQRYRTLRDTVADTFTAPVRRVLTACRRATDHDGYGENSIWALKDISFEVQRGEVVGIIGRNGAGKSTLLKVLSRITDPSEGYAKIHGRVGSLLEVGTGFHPELTGRENIFLNGAILGMSRAEIQHNFDRIVQFAEVEKFIETPVKHYSSGMYLRLAFAVAAHLEPEILLVDEVLAVGDVAFQKRCLGRMEEVAKEGRTVLFVSHNMGVIRTLCNRGIVLNDGRVELAGPIGKCIQSYYQSVGALQTSDGEHEAGGGGRNGFGRISIKDADGNSLEQSQACQIDTTLHLAEETNGFSLFCILEDMFGKQIFHLREESPQLGIKEVAAGSHKIAVRLPPLWLNPGLYALYFKVILWGRWGQARYVSDKFPLDVAGTSSLSESVLHPQTTWSIE